MNTSPEDYLKNIYIVKETVGKVTTSGLAEKMGITAPAVSDMISKLAKSGHIKNIPYKGFELTKKGEETAHKSDQEAQVVGSISGSGTGIRVEQSP
jgi:Mn-dependent DtxR family transcriptional regulator